MIYFIKYGIAIEFRILGRPLKIVYYWHKGNITTEGIVRTVLIGRTVYDPLIIYEIALLGLMFAVYDYSDMTFGPLENNIVLDPSHPGVSYLLEYPDVLYEYRKNGKGLYTRHFAYEKGGNNGIRYLFSR